MVKTAKTITATSQTATGQKKLNQNGDELKRRHTCTQNRQAPDVYFKYLFESSDYRGCDQMTKATVYRPKMVHATLLMCAVRIREQLSRPMLRSVLTA